MVAANTPDVPTLLRQAMDALTRGDKPSARDLLTSVLEVDDRNEQAWLWLSGAVDSPAEQRICLENVLLINPGSTAARQGVAYLDKQAAENPPPAGATPPWSDPSSASSTLSAAPGAAAPTVESPAPPSWVGGAALPAGWSEPAPVAVVPAWAPPPDQPLPQWEGLPPADPTNPWAGLRADAGTPAAAPAPESLPGMSGNWMDAFAGKRDSPLVMSATPPPGSTESAAVLSSDPTALTFGPTPNPSGANPWSNVEEAVPGLAAFGLTASATSAAQATPDSFLSLPQAPADFGVDDRRKSSPALIARPPVGERAAPVVPTIPCPNCNELVSENSLSCPRCSYRFYAPCPHCSDFIDTSAPDPRGRDVCPHCEQPVDKLALGQEPVRGAARRANPHAKVAASAVPAAPKQRGRGKKQWVDPRAPAGWEAAPVAARRGGGFGALVGLLVLVAVLVFLVFVLPSMLHLVPGVVLDLTPTP